MDHEKNSHHQQAGQLGGLARAQALSPKQRKEIASLGGINKGKRYAHKRAMSQGGKKSLVTLTDDERKQRARKAALVRWRKRDT